MLKSQATVSQGAFTRNLFFSLQTAMKAGSHIKPPKTKTFFLFFTLYYEKFQMY